MTWDKEKSQAKATSAAVGAAQGAGINSAALAAGVFVLRACGVGLPWPKEQDPEVLVAFGAIALALVPAWAWVRTYRRDKQKHGGNGVAPRYLGLILAWVAIGATSSGCLTLAPGVSGRDKQHASLVDVAGPAEVKVGKVRVSTTSAESQVTVVDDESRLGPGATKDSKNSMIYQFAGGGQLAYNTEAAFSNVARVDLLKHISSDQRAVLETLAPGFIKAFSAGLPMLFDYLGQRTQARAAAGESGEDPLFGFLKLVLGGLAGGGAPGASPETAASAAQFARLVEELKTALAQIDGRLRSLEAARE